MSTDLDALIDLELEKPVYQRRSQRLDDLFLTNTYAERLRAAKKSLDFLVPFNAALIVFDFLLLPDVASYSILSRWVLGSLTWYVIRSHKRASVEWLEGSIAVAIFSAMLMWAGLMLASHNRAGTATYYSTGVIALVVANVFFRCRFRLSLALSLALTALAVTLAAVLPEDWRFFVNGVGVYGAVCVLTLLASWKLGNEHYVNYLRTLKNERQQATIERHVADLFRLSNTDSLTGIANRRCIDETLRRYWHDWTQGRQCFVTVLVDVDFFKRFNDAYGHLGGDDCLVAVARALDDVVRERSGLVGRYGGEEFIALLACETDGEALEVAQAMRRSVENLKLEHGHRPDDIGHVTVSLGVTLCTGTGATDPDTIVALADQALYRAKAEGRNCIRFVALEEASHGSTRAA